MTEEAQAFEVSEDAEAVTQMTNFCGNVTIDVAFPAFGQHESAVVSRRYVLPLLLCWYIFGLSGLSGSRQPRF